MHTTRRWDEQRADEAHIVVRREPAHHDFARAYIPGGAHHVHVCLQVALRDDDALRIPGRPGRVLQEDHIVGADRR